MRISKSVGIDRWPSWHSSVPRPPKAVRYMYGCYMAIPGWHRLSNKLTSSHDIQPSYYPLAKLCGDFFTCKGSLTQVQNTMASDLTISVSDRALIMMVRGNIMEEKGRFLTNSTWVEMKRNWRSGRWIEKSLGKGWIKYRCGWPLENFFKNKSCWF